MRRVKFNGFSIVFDKERQLYKTCGLNKKYEAEIKLPFLNVNTAGNIIAHFNKILANDRVDCTVPEKDVMLTSYISNDGGITWVLKRKASDAKKHIFRIILPDSQDRFTVEEDCEELYSHQMDDIDYLMLFHDLSYNSLEDMLNDIKTKEENKIEKAKRNNEEVGKE